MWECTKKTSAGRLSAKYLALNIISLNKKIDTAIKSKKIRSFLKYL
ncbi:MAG: hypothetical protein ABIH18_06920 [Candidatus Omnitrophota bacterium]